MRDEIEAQLASLLSEHFPNQDASAVRIAAANIYSEWSAAREVERMVRGNIPASDEALSLLSIAKNLKTVSRKIGALGYLGKLRLNDLGCEVLARQTCHPSRPILDAEKSNAVLTQYFSDLAQKIEDAARLLPDDQLSVLEPFGGAKETQNRKQKPQNTTADLLSYPCALEYLKLAGERPVRISDEIGTYSLFENFLSDVFTCLDVKGSAATYAPDAIKRVRETLNE